MSVLLTLSGNMERSVLCSPFSALFLGIVALGSATHAWKITLCSVTWENSIIFLSSPIPEGFLHELLSVGWLTPQLSAEIVEQVCRQIPSREKLDL